MAKKELTPVQLNLNEFGAVTFEAGTTDGFKIPYTWADNKILLIFTNSGTAATLTIKRGNGIQGVTDLSDYSIAQDGYAAIRLDSGWFKQVSGEDKDSVIIVPSATTISGAVIQLP